MNPVRVGADLDPAELTHDVSLTDAQGNTIGLILCDANGNHIAVGISRNPIERTAVKTYSGDAKWSDQQYPFTPIAKQDWSGGRGLDDAERDASRYSDGYRADTSNGYIISGPQENYSSGLRAATHALPGNMGWIALLSNSQTHFIARKFVYNASAGEIAFWVRRVGNPGNLFVEIDRHYANDALIPGEWHGDSWTITTADITDVISEFIHLKLPAPVALTGENWVTFASDGDDENHWEIGVNMATNANTLMAEGIIPDTIVPAYFDVYLRISAPESGYSGAMMFHYKRALYALFNKDGAAPRLFLNGDRGAADAPTGGSNTLLDATKTWAANVWAGATVLIVGGKGANESRPFRKITSNTATQLTVDSAWKITHDTTTEYVILETPYWTEIGSHGLTAPVTSMIQSKDVLYFAQGEDVDIRRMRWTASALHEWASESGTKASSLTLVRQPDGLKIWRGNNGTTISVSKSDPKSWGTALSFGTATEFDDHLYGKITALAEYGDAVKKLFIMREGMIFTVDKDGTVDKIPLDEMATTMHYANGKVVMIHNVYLYFSMNSSLERYYGGELKDLGVNLDDGLPAERQGEVSALLGIPGRFFMAVNAGSAGYSSVYENNGLGWHEIYRAPKGKPITALAYQPIYGGSNRLWVAVGDDIVWLALPSMTTNRYNDPGMRYTHESVVTNGYMAAGMYDIWKLFYSLKLVADNLGDAVQVIVEWRADQDQAWQRIEESFTASPVQKLPISDLGVTGKRLQTRIRILTSDNTQTAKVRAMVLDVISRIEVKYAFGINYRIQEQDNNLLLQEDKPAIEKQAMIDAWAENLAPLYMRSRYAEYDRCVVFIDPSPSRPKAESSQDYIHQLTMMQVNIEGAADG